MPAAVTTLKPQRKPSHKSAVYRLHDAAPGRGVIAKRCRASIAATERVIYERVLPTLPVSGLEYYGSIEEPDGLYTWLFIEDAGDEGCTDADTLEFTEWLGRLHASASCRQAPDVPEPGPSHYLEHLRSARRRILAGIEAPHFLPDELDVQQRVVRLLDLLEGRWPQLETVCRPFPKTLVHGDLSSKNIRVRRTRAGAVFFALDWETGGWAVPAADLAGMSQGHHDAEGDASRQALIDAYLSIVRSSWQCTRSEVELLAHVGVMFRMAAAIDWVSRSLPYPPGRKPVHCLRSYEGRIWAAMSHLGWDQ
jgi:hypothetical protein